MGKSDYQDFIQKYDTLRWVLRAFYVYGHYSREDFKNQKISGRKYDNERRRLFVFLPKNVLVERYENRKKLISFYYDYFDCVNYLSKTYHTKSFKPIDVSFYIQTMQYLNNHPEGISAPALWKQLELTIDLQSAQRRMTTMASFGYLVAHRAPTHVTYQLADDPFKLLDTEQLKRLYRYVDFYANKSALSVPGHFLLQTLSLYMAGERSMSTKGFSEGIFLYKHRHINLILENEVMYTLLHAITQHKLVGLYHSDAYMTLLPLKIIVDHYHGRAYLLYKHTKDSKSGLLRLDKVEQVELKTNL